MEYLIAFIAIILAAIVAMMFMTMAYHLFYGVMPIIAIIMIVAGLAIGLWNTIRNTLAAFKEVYSKK